MASAGGVGTIRTFTIALCLTLVVTGSASALRSTGDLVVQGSVSLPPASDISATPVGLVGDSANLRAFRFASPDVSKFCYFEWKFLQTLTVAGEGVFTPIGNPEGGCNHLNGGVVQLAQGNHDGWFSISAVDAAATILTDDRTLSVALANDGSLASPDATQSSMDLEAPEQPYFHKTLRDHHLATNVSGKLSLQGHIQVKLKGPDIAVQAQGMARQVKITEDRQDESAPVRERVMRWVYLESSNATLEVETSTQLNAAFSVIEEAFVEGTVVLPAAFGHVAMGEVTLLAKGESITLDGLFRISLSPGKEGLVVLLEGNAKAIPAALVRAPMVGGSSPGGSWLLLVGVALGATGVGAAAWWHVKTRRRTGFSLVDCIDAAGLARESDDLQEALLWTRRARGIDPDRVSLVVEEADLLASLDRMEEALSVLKEADEMAPDGEPALEAARILDRKEYPPEAVEYWLGRALAKSPQMLEEVEVEFPEMGDRPAWREIRQRAMDAQRGGHA